MIKLKKKVGAESTRKSNRKGLVIKLKKKVEPEERSK